MADFTSIETLAQDLKTKLDAVTTKKKVVALYAFNATGKTRLSNLLNWENESWDVLLTEDWDFLVTENGDKIIVDNGKIKTLCYNAFLEDMFTWDNENYILKFNPHSWIIKLIVDEGLEADIVDNFKDIINSNDLKLEPSFDFAKWEVTFKIASGDDVSASNIKISKGEESIFIWSVFYTILEAAISELILLKEDRSTDAFDDLEYIILDDPVSSIDDTRIIALAIKTINLIKNDHIADKLEYKKKELAEQEFTPEYIENRLQDLRAENYTDIKLKFLITTHHALFYNVLVNSFKREKDVNFKSFSLSRDSNVFRLTEQWDSPFSYHLSVKELIQKAINNDSIEKYHFNLFRALLEKTSNFLWYENWYDCVHWENKQESIRLLNLYSHSRLSDLEPSEMSVRDKDLFQQAFKGFTQQFNWNN